MDESKLIGRLSRRARVPRSTARAVLKALLDLLQEEGVGKQALLSSDSMRVAEHGDRTQRPGAEHLPISHHSDPRVVDELIARARNHELGIEFLLDGFLASVAAEFGAHAFTVEAARQRLRSERRNGRGSDGN